MSAIRPGTCAEPGPWGAHCSLQTMHDWAHYDGGDDVSFADGWREWTSVEGGGTIEDEDE